MKNIVVTGANGFIAKNIISFLSLNNEFNIIKITREDDLESLQTKLSKTDILLHFAGVNRPTKINDLDHDNILFTKLIIDELLAINKKCLFIMSSSIQAILNNNYGISKKKAEEYVIAKSVGSRLSSHIYRFPGIFGKGCMPNYNSVVATYCYNISKGLPIVINNPETVLNLMHVDDIAKDLMYLFNNEIIEGEIILKEYINVNSIKLIDLANKISYFRDSIINNIIPEQKNKFEKDLFNTFMSYQSKT